MMKPQSYCAIVAQCGANWLAVQVARRWMNSFSAVKGVQSCKIFAPTKRRLWMHKQKSAHSKLIDSSERATTTKQQLLTTHVTGAPLYENCFGKTYSMKGGRRWRKVLTARAILSAISNFSRKDFAVSMLSSLQTELNNLRCCRCFQPAIMCISWDFKVLACCMIRKNINYASNLSDHYFSYWLHLSLIFVYIVVLWV